MQGSSGASFDQYFTSTDSREFPASTWDVEGWIYNASGTANMYWSAGINGPPATDFAILVQVNDGGNNTSIQERPNTCPSGNSSLTTTDTPIAGHLNQWIYGRFYGDYVSNIFRITYWSATGTIFEDKTGATTTGSVCTVTQTLIGKDPRNLAQPFVGASTQFQLYNTTSSNNAAWSHALESYPQGPGTNPQSWLPMTGANDGRDLQNSVVWVLNNFTATSTFAGPPEIEYQP